MKTSITIILLLFLFGCSSNPPLPEPPEISQKEFIVPECGEPTPLPFFAISEVEWVLRVIEEKPYWTLDTLNYSNLGLNTSNILKNASILREQRDFYIQCIENAKAAAEANSTVDPQ